MTSASPYNPLEKSNLGDSVVRALLRQDPARLDTATSLVGAGVYAIYYAGDFAAYGPIARPIRRQELSPIYVGKAIPKGGRKGGLQFDATAGRALAERLTEHLESIRFTRTLDDQHFTFRSLMLDDIWIPLAENMLIERYSPIWNVVIDGFGNHDPGAGRHQQDRSPWDVLHPGRLWAPRLANPLFTKADILGRLEDYFAGRPLRRLPRHKKKKKSKDVASEE